MQEVTSPMGFHSILFDRPENRLGLDEREEPSSLADLNLDQVLESMTAGREEYNLKPFFYTPLRDVESVAYRHEILRDLEGKPLFESIRAFAREMRSMRQHLTQAEKLRYKYQKERWFLDAVEIYCGAVSALTEGIAAVDVQSRGFLSFREYLTEYAASDDFTSLAAETRKLDDDLAEVKYSLHIRGNRVKVDRYEGEADYSAEVEDTFAKFKQGAVKNYRVKLPDWPAMDHVEASILDLVARLYPDVFLELDEYCGRHRDYLDPPISGFDREIQFYVAYLEFIERLKSTGLTFCCPEVSSRSKEIYVREAFDLALATRLIPENSSVVCNDFSLEDPERVFVVTGPNQGGKTTFSRMFGQIHYLASLGYPVPGEEARLFLPDRLFTHFEKEEDLSTLRGKLEDELIRVHEILQRATGDSILIMNESFTSTTVSDALFLGKEIMKRIVDLDLLCVYVTFVDELASLNESTVSMVSTVVPENPTVRTYRIVRRPADGLAYAAAIAEKYGLTYESLGRRIGR
jgi:DNA mismatch repair protein MutS